jgi:hypothetical protein
MGGKLAEDPCKVGGVMGNDAAMAAWLSDYVWELGELVALMPKPLVRPWGRMKRAEVADGQGRVVVSYDCDRTGVWM